MAPNLPMQAGGKKSRQMRRGRDGGTKKEGGRKAKEDGKLG